MESQIAASLNDMTNGGENAVLMLNSMKQMMGDDWKTVVRQLSTNKSMGNDARVLSSVSNPNSQKFVAEALSFSVKEYKDLADPAVIKDITDNSADTLSDLAGTFATGYGPEGLKSWGVYKEALERTAMKLVADNKHSSYSSALEEAKDIIFGDVEVISTYRVPRMLDGKETNIYSIETGVLIAKTMIKDGRLPIQAPPSAGIENLEDANQVYRQMLTITPITSLDGSGIAFIDQFGNIIQNAKGEDFEYTWHEINDLTMQHEFEY